MEAGKKWLVKFLENQDTVCIIPVFQRPYSWEKGNCEQLWNDLKDVWENGYKSHFFGSVVVSTHTKGSTEERIIIDG